MCSSDLDVGVASQGALQVAFLTVVPAAASDAFVRPALTPDSVRGKPDDDAGVRSSVRLVAESAALPEGSDVAAAPDPVS